MGRREDVSDPVARQAIEWMVLLKSGEATPQDAAEFEQWRRADASHDAACQRIERTLGRIGTVGTEGGSAAVRSALIAPSSRRKIIVRALSFVGLAAGAGLLRHQLPVDDLMADTRTSVGQRKTLKFADGSAVILNARSAMDLKSAGTQRSVRLFHGQMLARVASGTAVPFVVHTDMADVAANAGQFSVQHSDDAIRVLSLDARVRIRNRAGQTHQLERGQGVEVTAQRIARVDCSPLADTAWVDGVLQVSDKPLADVVVALRDYRPGIIRLDSAAANLRVSGVFPLDDTDFVLDALAQTMPVVIQKTTAYWVSIHAA